MKRLTYMLVTLTFSFACFGLWAILNLLSHTSIHGTEAFPRFTALLIGLRAGLLLLPVPVVGYCIFALLRQQTRDANPITFLACSMSALCLVFFPVLLAVFLPCVVLMERAWIK
jgi:hypothetical protein